MRKHATCLLALGALALASFASTGTAANLPSPAPRLTALTSHYTAGKQGFLFFRASAGSGRATVSIGVFDDVHQLWTKVIPHARIDAGVRYSSVWTPRVAGTYQFCLMTQDRTGQQSAASCAMVHVR